MTSTLKVILAYLILLVCCLGILNQVNPELLNSSNFLNWDAQHYHWIKTNGYKHFRVAFFPLFPILWKLTGLGIYGIVVLNGLFFLAAFYLLIKHLQATVYETMLYLSIPSFIFFFLPYSESLFFVGSVILLLGLKERKYFWVIAGLLVSTITRPAFSIFIPALLVVEFLSSETIKLRIKRMAGYVIIVVIGLAVVGLIQYYFTHEWFQFFNAQKLWGNKLQMPLLPLTSWAGGFIVRVDAVAFLFGTCAGILMLLYLLKSKIVRHVLMPPEVVFSLCYLGGITLMVLLFRGGSLFSLNRFVFAVPFIVVAINFYLKQVESFTNKHLLFGFLFISAFWLLFGSYVHIQTLFKFLLLSVYICIFLGLKAKQNEMRAASQVLLILVNLVLQFVFFYRFLNDVWVG